MMEYQSRWCTPQEYEKFKAFLVREAKGKPVCFYCKRPIDLKLTRGGGRFTIDHLKPKATHPALAKMQSNMVCAHGSCNSAKGMQTAEKALAIQASMKRGSRTEWDPPKWLS